MKIGLLGYGKMGKVIEDIALNRGHSITFASNSSGVLIGKSIVDCDVAIEFSNPDSVANNIELCFYNNVPVVVGTTGWNNLIEKISQNCINTNQALFYSSNFSIGVNVFFAINKKLASLMNGNKEYSIKLEETHHTEKLDAPSGTAITLANDILANLGHIKSWKEKGSSNQNDLEIISHRIDDIPGTHVIKYESDIDSIQISHIAKNRKGFALGSVLAAEWIIGKKGVFTMSDLLNI